MSTATPDLTIRTLGPAEATSVIDETLKLFAGRTWVHRSEIADGFTNGLCSSIDPLVGETFRDLLAAIDARTHRDDDTAFNNDPLVLLDNRFMDLLLDARLSLGSPTT